MIIYVTRTSIVSGIERTKHFEVEPEQVKAYNEGASIQHAFPQLDADDREFIINGVTKEESDEIYKDTDK